MMALPTGITTDPWEIVAYEARMLFELCGLLSGKGFKPGSEIANNALVESACLHTRILADILLSKDSGRGDDICLNKLLPGFQHSLVDQLKATYGDSKTEGSTCWFLNKMIAHPTLKRGTSYDYTNILKQLVLLIETLWQEIEPHCRALPKRSGGIDPAFCAKTSS